MGFTKFSVKDLDKEEALTEVCTFWYFFFGE